MVFNNYSKPGKGVEKRDPNQPRILTFFDILSRKLWSLVKLTFLHFLVSSPFLVISMIVVGVVSVPVIEIVAFDVDINRTIKMDTILRIALSYIYMIFLGYGPVTAGYTYIIRKFVEERHCWLMSDYFEGVKTNLKKTVVLWIVDLIVFYLLVVAFKFYNQSGFTILQYVIIGIACVYLLTHVYIYQMIVTFDLSIKNSFMNSLLLAIGKIPISISVFLCNIIIHAIIPISIFLNVGNLILGVILFIVDILLIAPIENFAINFYIIPMLKKNIGK